jgi:hypothetical protein
VTARRDASITPSFAVLPDQQARNYGAVALANIVRQEMLDSIKVFVYERHEGLSSL